MATRRGTNHADNLRGTSHKDKISGRGGSDKIDGRGGNDLLLGGTGNDRLKGGTGSDKLDGGSGRDWLDGGTGSDKLYGGSGNDRLYGKSGQDRLDGGAGLDKLYGDTGNDRLYGKAGNDQLSGGSGNDRLYGGTGNDRLSGGTGNDYLEGGSGRDTAVLALNRSAYSITRLDNGDVQLTSKFGVTKAHGIEVFRFADGTLDADVVVPPTIYTIAVAPDSVFEGSAGAGKTITYTVSRSGDIGHNGAVAVALSGTATASDYVVNGLAGGLVRFAAGASKASFTVTTIPDTSSEPDETVVATLGAITGGGRIDTSNASAGATILSDDGGQYVIAKRSAGLTFDQARALAGSLDGELASLSTPAEHRLILDALAETDAFWAVPSTPLYSGVPGYAIGPWIGLEQIQPAAEPAGGWTWLDGSVFRPFGWYPSQPDNLRAEDVAAFVKTSTATGWIDLHRDPASLGYGAVNSAVVEVAASKAALSGTNDVDFIIGGKINNILDGKRGADFIQGGAGNDIYHVDNGRDRVIEADDEGADSVLSSVSYVLANDQAIENLTLTGTSARDATGNGLRNVMTGNATNNHLDGGLGNDILEGQAGRDTFVFDTALGATNVDRIADFTRDFDRIELDHTAVFTRLSVSNRLAADQFKDISSPATQLDENDYIQYDRRSGRLYYDADGNGAEAKVLFAILHNHAVLQASDFLIT